MRQIERGTESTTKKTRQIMETIHVKFDELIEQAADPHQIFYLLDQLVRDLTE